ncbi:MAG: nucleotide exchange factor GrpE [candidate division WOR-3 bacterium]|nr:nucleotide exchange factor GrpE [candidate division WOR-3 bacterium]MCX7837663.1 nucleotide exchange factor GrpE [candidate division WOR-3 bacterium]MDW8113381.1 nucleotide exchange factor GrpE [candidate division WOR-3 bacterium]
MEKKKVGPVSLLKDSYLRLLAEFDNFRKRKEREVLMAKELSLKEFFMDIIPVLENFNRALFHSQLNNNFQSLKRGLEIIYNQIKSILEKHGLKEYSLLEKDFDPKYAEAVGYVETDKVPPNTIVEEVSKGYIYKDCVLKPAQVIVSKEKQNPSEE